MTKIIRIDANCGDAAAALRTAMETIRRARREESFSGSAIIELTGGTYHFQHGVCLSQDDSGTADMPFIIRAVQGQAVRFSGGRPLDGFMPVTDSAALTRLPPGSRGAVQQCDLRSQGVTNLGAFHSRGFGRPVAPAMLELFYKGKLMPLACWPQDGFSTIKGVPEEGKDEFGGNLGASDNGFFYDSDRPAHWSSVQDIIVHGYWAYDWANSYERISLLDPAKKHIKLSPPGSIYGLRTGQRIQFFNILEELNAPGQWCLEQQTGILYFRPPEPLQSNDVIVSLLEEPFLTLENTANVRIEGITFESARGTGISINGGSDCSIDKCVFRNLGNYAVIVSGGARHEVTQCEISELGDGGIYISGGDRKTLTPANHTVSSNHIHHVGRWSKCYVPAVAGHGVGIRIANNLIHDHPHCAILFSGNGITVEYNEIYRVCLETGDVGAVYTGRDYTFRDNTVRYNFIHHTGGVGMGSMGIYNDDCVSGTVMFGNIFWKVQRAVFLGGGRDFRVENNIFVDCTPAVELDGRGISRESVWRDMVYKTMKERLEDMNWRQPPYSERYPELAALVPFYEKQDGIPPGNIRVSRNICMGGEWTKIHWGANSNMVEFENNLTGIDPQFVDAVNGNFEMKETSPAFKIGFQRIPTEKIGQKRPCGCGRWQK